MLNNHGGDADALEPLEFFPRSENEFPILARLALILLAICCCSADVERLFSKSGLIFTKKRTRLLPDRVNILMTTLKSWLDGAGENLEEYTVPTVSQNTVQESNKRFVTLNVMLEVQEPTLFEEDFEDDDDDEDADNEEDVEEDEAAVDDVV
jgi:hypothetical protein